MVLQWSLLPVYKDPWRAQLSIPHKSQPTTAQSISLSTIIMSLQSGQYTIRSCTEGNPPIGVSSDSDNGRCKVVVLSEGSEAPVVSTPHLWSYYVLPRSQAKLITISQWTVENVPQESTFVIKTSDGKGVNEENGVVWAGGSTTGWQLEAAFHHGQNNYVYASTDSRLCSRILPCNLNSIQSLDDKFVGWMAPFKEEENNQVKRVFSLAAASI